MTESPDNAPGHVDIHAHLIPGVDDGCRSIDEVVQCIERLQDYGYIGSVCTPHLLHTHFPDNTPENVTRWTDDLRQALAERGVDYRLWPGGELQIHEETLSWISDVGLRPMGDGRCILCDTWLTEWTDDADRVVDFILEQGYRVILAHPERLPMEDFDGVLDHLQQRGIWLQGNFNSLSGGEGPTAHQRSLRLLREQRYRFLAMDMHRIHTLPQRLEGYLTAEMTVGPEKLAELVRDNPLSMLAGESTS